MILFGCLFVAVTVCLALSIDAFYTVAFGDAFSQISVTFIYVIQ